MLRLRTLGALALERDGSPLTGRATQRRRLALLALLATARDATMPRDRLLAFLWPERATDLARHSLSQTIYALRQELGDDAILCGVDEVRLDLTVVTADVAEFERARASGELANAAALYGGPFLDGFFVSDAEEFGRWVEEERARLARAYGEVLEALARESASRSPSEAVSWWRKRAALDPMDSRIALALVRALIAAGDRAGALAHARVHDTLLQQELGLPPDAEIARVVRRLREAPAPVLETRVGASTDVSAGTPEPVTDASQSIANAPVTPASLPSGRPGRRWRVRGAALVAGSALLLASTIALARLGPEELPTARRSVVIGAIAGPDATLGLAVREAVLAELSSEPRVRVLDDAAMRETLRLMRLPLDTTVDAGIAADLAQRRGASLVVTGSVVPIGHGALVTARLVDAATGATLLVLNERPSDGDEIIPAVVRLARGLRERALGILADTGSPPLPAVTTSSIEALRDFALARRRLAWGDRPRAISLLESAIAHDSSFALAHQLVGDLWWYVDQQSRSDRHLERALALSDRLPARERLIVRARAEQLVRDRPDSALAYWRLMRDAYGDDPLAFDGMIWAYRALGDFAAASALADTAIRRDPYASLTTFQARLTGLMSTGDTAEAREFVRQYGPRIGSVQQDVDWWSVVLRRQWSAQLAYARSLAGRPEGPGSNAREQILLLATGHLAEGERLMSGIVADGRIQNPPRALVLQARAELAFGGSREHAAALAREALRWMRNADLSPPAYARLGERVADVAARAGDRRTLEAVRRFLVERDAGRGLRSYRIALTTLDAYRAYADGRYAEAASLAAAAQHETFFGRSLSTVMLLERDALRAAGARARADSLTAQLVARPPGRDGDGDTWIVLREIAARN